MVYSQKFLSLLQSVCWLQQSKYKLQDLDHKLKEVLLQKEWKEEHVIA